MLANASCIKERRDSNEEKSNRKKTEKNIVPKAASETKRNDFENEVRKVGLSL